MSYRPPEQSIEGPAHDIAEAVDRFSAAVDRRLASGDWSEDHISRLEELEARLHVLRYPLLRLAEETW
jgi:hypothetical protein